MIFKGTDNQIVEFKIVGYQFPHITTPEDYDSNWLNIYINVKSNLGNWDKVDPSLLTSEFKSLINWFKDLAVNKISEVGFTEPNLDFSYQGADSNTKKIRISFDCESKPQSAKDTEEEYYVDCVYTNEELTNIANELEKELSSYPAR